MMKKLFLFVVMGALTAGCATSAKNEPAEDSLTNQYSKYQIVDQEFDNLVVPNDSYDRVAPYEEQVSSSSFIQSSTRKTADKPARKMTGKKTVVDGEGNILPEAAEAPVTDQEALPDEPGADLAAE